MPGGARVHSIAEAAASLAFTPVVARRFPRRLGPPTIVVDRLFGELALLYNQSDSRKHWPFEDYSVTERPAGSTTTGVLRAIAKACVSKGGCEASARMIPLKYGNEGLLMTGTAATGLIWVDGGVYFDVSAPSNGPVVQIVAERVITAKERRSATLR